MNGAYRAYELAAAWQAAGHDVQVIMSSFTSSNQDDHHAANFSVNNVPYSTVRTCVYKGNGIGRLISMAFFAFRLNFVASQLPKNVTKPDAIIYSTVHPFGIFAAKRLAKKFGVKLVYEIRDFWPLTLTELLNVNAWHPFAIVCAFTERYAVKHADVVSSVLPRAHLYFSDRNIPIKDYTWVPNGFSALHRLDKSEVSAKFCEALNFIKQEHDKGRLIIVHAGAIGPPNALNRLFDAFEIGENQHLKHISFLAIGDGIQRTPLEERASGLKSMNCHFSGSLTKEETQQLLEHCDIGYAGGNNLPQLYRYGIAFNKIASYLDAELPVLLPLEPCGDPVSESGAGIAGAFETGESLLAAIKTFAGMTDKNRKEMGKLGKAYLIENYDYRKIAQNYLEAIF